MNNSEFYNVWPIFAAIKRLSWPKLYGTILAVTKIIVLDFSSLGWRVKVTLHRKIDQYNNLLALYDRQPRAN